MVVKKYIRQALEICLKMNENNQFLLITDRETEELGKEFANAAQVIAPQKKHYYFVMEDFGERNEDTPLQIPDEMLEAFDNVDLSIYAAQGKKGELESFRLPMLKKITSTKKVRHGHMPGVTKEILINGFGHDYQKVVDLTHKVFDKIKNARRATVKTSLGTNLNVEFNPNYKWIPSDAIINPREYGNIPSGEVFTCVENCEGKLIIDGEIGDYLCAKYGILSDNPVEITIKDGRASQINCKNKELVKDLENYFRIDENANRVGEFAIGTNINLKKFIGNLLLDEKFPGMHVAFGSGYPDKTGASWDGKAHLDCIVTKPTIKIDDKIIMDNGSFML